MFYINDLPKVPMPPGYKKKNKKSGSKVKFVTIRIPASKVAEYKKGKNK